MRFKIPRLRKFFVLAVAGLIAALVAGCAQPSPPSTKPAAPADKPKAPAQNILRRAFAYGGDPGNVDPMIAGRIGAMTVVRAIFDTLVFYDAVKGEFQPRIAKEWKISKDGKVYTFILNQGVKFHNGRELVADDVKYSIERVLNPDNASPNAGGFQDIVGAKEFQAKKAKEVTGIKVKGKYEIEISLTRPNPVFMYNISGTAASVVPKEEVERLKDKFGHEPVGSGPFVFVSWRKDDRIIVKANENWFKGKPSIDGIEFRVLPETATQEAEFLAGNLDYIVLTSAQYKKYANDPKWKPYVVEVPELFTRFFCFNTTKPPFDKVEVRQAFNYAIDKDAIVKSVLHDKAVVATGVLPPSIAGFNKNLKGYEYNPEKAKELLKKAGYPNGFEAEILCTDNPSWGLPPIEAAMGYLSKVGIKLKPVLMDANTMMDRSRAGTFQIYSHSTGADASALAYIYYRFHSSQAEGGLGNRARYKNKEVDALLDRAMSESDLKKQIELVQKAEEIIVRDAPWFFFNYNKAAILRQPWLEGVEPVPTDIDLQVPEKMKIKR